MPSSPHALSHWRHTTAPVCRAGNKSSVGVRRLLVMTQLTSMEPGFQPASVCAQNPDGFHNFRLLAEEETEAREGCLAEGAWGRTLALHAERAFGEGKRSCSRSGHWDPAPAFSSPAPPLPRQQGSAARGPRAPVGWSLAWSSREECLPSALEATCSFKGWGPRELGHRPVTWPQGRGQPPRCVCEPASSCRELWPARPYLSSRDQRGHCSCASVGARQPEYSSSPALNQTLC